MYYLLQLCKLTFFCHNQKHNEYIESFLQFLINHCNSLRFLFYKLVDIKICDGFILK